MRRKDKMVVEVTAEELAVLIGHSDWTVEHLNQYDHSYNNPVIHIVLTKEWRNDGS